jgi:hypothetical protein
MLKTLSCSIKILLTLSVHKINRTNNIIGTLRNLIIIILNLVHEGTWIRVRLVILAGFWSALDGCG